MFDKPTFIKIPIKNRLGSLKAEVAHEFYFNIDLGVKFGGKTKIQKS